MTSEYDLKLENMKQDHEVDMKKLEWELKKKKKGNPNGAINAVLLGSCVLGGITLIGTLVDKANLLKNNPEQTWWWERLGSKPLEAKIVEGNPNPEPNPPALTLKANYLKGGQPSLRPKYAHSATSYDHVSLAEKAQRDQFKRATPTAQPNPRQSSMLQRSKGHRLTYSSDSGRGYSKEELERIDEQAT